MAKPVEACEIGEPDPMNQARRFVMSARRRGTDAAAEIIATVHEVASSSVEGGLHEITDQLTGLAGRHHFMSHVRSVLSQRGTWRPTAIFLLDIDNFKGVNDLYGAGIGDGVLKIIANRLFDRDPLALDTGTSRPRGRAAAPRISSRGSAPTSSASLSAAPRRAWPMPRHSPAACCSSSPTR